MRRYLVNEIFHSLQGEGMRAGTAAVFLRLARCNLDCSIAGGEGFDCDTDFTHGTRMTADQILHEMHWYRTDWVIITGGEPAIQLDADLIDALHTNRRKVAVETNGTIALTAGIDWVCCSPKPGHPVVLTAADEWKFILGPGDPLPEVPGPGHLLLSPRFHGRTVDGAALDHCIELIHRNPQWRLSCQQHKWWDVR